MYPVTDRYLDTLARSHTRLQKVEVLHDGDVVATLQGGQITDPLTGLSVQSIGGSLSVDKTNIRRSGSINFLDVSGQLLPDQARDLFAPLSTEIRPWVGLQYWDATPAELIAGTATEWVPLITMVVTDVAGAYPQISLSGYDRMWLVGTFPFAYGILHGSQIDDELRLLLSRLVPKSRYQSNIPNSDFTTGGALYTENSDAAEAAHSLANAAGWELFVDPMGVFTAKPEADWDDDPVMIYQPGSATVRSMLMRPPRALAATGAFNAVVATGEATDIAPVRGFAQDNNPASITYAPRVGIRPYFMSSPQIRTQAQADLAARTRLRNMLGIPDMTTVPVIPNHALEPGDVIVVVDPEQDLSMKLIIDSFPLPYRATDGVQVLSGRGNGGRWSGGQSTDAGATTGGTFPEDDCPVLTSTLLMTSPTLTTCGDTGGGVGGHLLTSTTLLTSTILETS